MSRDAWRPRPLAQSFGVALTLDLANLDSDGPRDLLISLRRSKLLLVRSQNLDEDAYVRLGSSLGRVWTVDGELRGNAESPHAVRARVEIARVSNKGGMLQDRAVDWHGDLAHHPTHPYPGRILYAKAIPQDAVSVTSWVDLEYGWNHLLSDEERRAIAGQTGKFQAGYETEWGSTEHAIVRRHPARGAEWASIDRAFLRNFVGMSPEQSAELKKRVLGKLIVGAAMYRHAWEPGDVIIYDNEGTMHRRERVYSDAERTIWRLTLQYAWSMVA
jgi:alpha-ketoglutarate-dependent taurine dioxygenase